MINKNTFKYIYSGIYDSYELCKKKNKFTFYNDKIYENKQKKIINKIAKNILSKKLIEPFYKQHTQYLINAISLNKKKHINVLDFGGGWGVGYANCIEAFGKKKLSNLTYHIFDLNNVCEIGKKYFKERFKIKKNLEYFDNFEDLKSTKYDIIFLGSSLQYFYNPFEVLNKIIELNSPIIILIDTYLTETKTFFTNQKYYNIGVPHSFLNKKKFLFLFREKYKLKSLVNSHTQRLGEIGKINMINFKKKYRVDYSLNLIFVKNDK